MAFCGVLAGCSGWDALAAFGKAKRSWFEQWFELPYGPPSSDTFQRVLEVLAPQPFAEAFDAWLAALRQQLPGDLVALDGKALKGAFSGATRASPLYLLHAWNTTQKVLLGQMAVDGAPGELAGIEALLKVLEVAGTVVATDANGCTQKNAAAIVDKEADYLFGLKGNRGPIYNETRGLFEEPSDAAKAAMQVHREADKGHGRLEERETTTLPASLLGQKRCEAWKGLQTLVCVERTRTVQGKSTKERQYYLSSQRVSAEQLGTQIRQYWSIENELHWVLDATWGEDRCRIRNATSAHNFGTLRRNALMLLRHPASGRGSIAMKQRMIGWDDAYLLKVLSAPTQNPADQVI